MSIRCLLWDFGDTLCDEKFIWSSGPQWEHVYRLFDEGLGEAWNTGDMSDQEFAELIAEHISLTPPEILAHMQERCRHVEFYDFTYNFYLARHLPQAIVTVNPRIWTDVISPHYNFDQTADLIVTSWEEGTTDKATLCELAVDRLGIGCKRSESLLIDNISHNIGEWRLRGGGGYHFRGDDQFEKDVADGVDGLVG